MGQRPRGIAKIWLLFAIPGAYLLFLYISFIGRPPYPPIRPPRPPRPLRPSIHGGNVIQMPDVRADEVTGLSAGAGVETGVPGFEAVEREAKNKTIAIIPVNSKWVHFAVNAWCTLNAQTSRRNIGIIVLALDHEIIPVLKKADIPVYFDPSIEDQEGGNWQGGSQGKKTKDGKATGFNSLVCSKLLGVLNLLKRGYKTLLVDADVAVKGDIWPDLASLEAYDMTWSWGGHQDPMVTKNPFTPSCERRVTPGRCYVNTGYYFIHPRKGVIEFMETANRACQNQGPTRMGDKDDQTYVNEILVDQMDKAQGIKPRPTLEDMRSKLGYTTACFNPCDYNNGNTYFQFHTQEKRGKLPITVHANFMRGDKKEKKMKKSSLWDSVCVNRLLGRDG